MNFFFPKKYLQVKDCHSLSRSDPVALKLSLLGTIKCSTNNLSQCLSERPCERSVAQGFHVQPRSLRRPIPHTGPGAHGRGPGQARALWANSQNESSCQWMH